MTNFTPDLFKKQRVLLPARLLACSLFLPFYAAGTVGTSIPVTHQVRTKIQVSGVIRDQLGPLPGATVLEKASGNGTVADADGNFSLAVPPTLCWKLAISDTKHNRL
jgi:CarboxypepD_reg-like domain